MAEHPNATVYRKLVDRFAAGDDTGFSDVIADDVVWWQIGSKLPIRGKKAVVDSMRRLEGVELTVDVHDVLASDEHVVGLITATVRTGDRTFTYRTAEIAHIRDGKVTERWAFADDTRAITEFFSRRG